MGLVLYTKNQQTISLSNPDSNAAGKKEVRHFYIH